MIKEWALENVEAIFALHTAYRWPTGVVASRPGEFLAGCGAFKAKISGKGGHAAIPHDTIDPILAVAVSVISLQNIVSRETDPLDSQDPKFLENSQTKKFVLVHGEGFGAWCWYKNVALLEEAVLPRVILVGHRLWRCNHLICFGVLPKKDFKSSFVCITTMVSDGRKPFDVFV
ncbi:hypothetical protein IFM89_038185 [Coptis chinensis]|uniref:Peptidase M20 dimerisation domain-containing protein n=1 Tax=Coptis chinensis TaxID=261450 RepID=A0A835I9D0_9MAGN|nr:hypothetical protein IFM89_038185 [Coptis chinensis]